ncbi:hypothetical protein L6164_020105 [Bauhinia variegata]|uniref:Uncharacterized protein n=1 Tax=Bauhinia variegata TaxID=167791 RepID=A0ACB9MXF6_BAUVA|nr:hypothetical protein L6164_020105 [Bauhinia variegata]
MSTLSPISSSDYSILFDLDESLAAAEEACRIFSATKCFVSNLPLVDANDINKHNQDVCSVCMEAFRQHNSAGAEGNKRLPCGHVYHATCITTWLSRATSPSTRSRTTTMNRYIIPYFFSYSFFNLLIPNFFFSPASEITT